jgi:pimeloyl-ACP methyl ester carboxylesterase
MKTLKCVPVILFCVMLNAQDITGDWQGTVRPAPGSENSSAESRIVTRISRGDDGGWKALVYIIDQSTDPQRADSIVVNGPSIKFTINSLRASYVGKIDADGRAMRGIWTQGQPRPLDLLLAPRIGAWPIDETSHSSRFVTVDSAVKLEVLDWGGGGRPLILLAGLGNTAHIFDKFAIQLAESFHVYGITRRGFGASSKPLPTSANYAADRLGDDVLEVIEALKLQQPILVGHSMAGEELSSIGSRHPEKIAGLVYLDGGYAYAFYDSDRGDFNIDLNEFQRKLQQVRSIGDLQAIRELLAELPRLERSLRLQEKRQEGLPVALRSTQSPSPVQDVPAAMRTGEQRYTKISAPILAIFAVPKPVSVRGVDEATLKAIVEAQAALDEAQAKAFETGIPTAQVVRIPNAEHYVFYSNASDVLIRIRSFAASLN